MQSQTARVAGRRRGKALDAELGAGAYHIVRSEGVGPKVGGELQEKALIAILFSFVTTLIYLAFRFEWRFGLAAVVATAHDVLATIAFIRYLDLEVSLVVVAAILTVLGYSLNDTIVIFDRVRENLQARARRSPSRAPEPVDQRDVAADDAHRRHDARRPRWCCRSSPVR